MAEHGLSLAWGDPRAIREMTFWECMHYQRWVWTRGSIPDYDQAMTWLASLREDPESSDGWNPCVYPPGMWRWTDTWIGGEYRLDPWWIEHHEEYEGKGNA